MKKINTFWNWFQDNNQTIQNLINENPQNQKHISFWMSKNLGYYSREIDLIIIFQKKNTDKTELIITANGNPDYFGQVINLVDKAPQLRNWKFTAFIDAKETVEKRITKLDQQFIIQDINLKEDQVQLIPISMEKHCNTLHILIHLKNKTICCSNKTLDQAIFVILEKLSLSPILFETINLVQLPQSAGQEIVMTHLYEFQEYLNEHCHE